LTSPLDPPADRPAPAEQIATARRDLDDTIEKWRNRQTARAVLFVGGGWHGMLRALRPEDRSVIILVESLDMEPAEFWTTPPEPSQPARIRRTQYRREEYVTVDDDTVTTVEVWHHKDVAAGTPEGYRLAADAALRALASTGMIDSHTRRRTE
jgi:hypothetical protein